MKRGDLFVHKFWVDANRKPLLCVVTAVRQGLVYWRHGGSGRSWFSFSVERADMHVASQSLPADVSGCSPWIDVQDRFPDDARDVLTFGSFGIHRACFEWGSEDDPCWWSSEVREATFKESVTHWAELPEWVACK